MSAQSVTFSVVIPVKNESGNIEPVVTAIAAACDGRTFEVIYANDGSTDDTAAKIDALKAQYPWLKRIDHATSGGQSAAVHSGTQAAQYNWIVTLDGDGQNPPSEIPKLLAKIDGSDTLGLIAGQRQKRKDTLSKRLASKFANGIRSWILKDGTRDTGCGLKAFRRDAFLELPYFDHMHRYLPALFTAYGWSVAHVDVAHAERHSGTSNYNNLQRGLVGIYDLIGVTWLIRRRKKARPVKAD